MAEEELRIDESPRRGPLGRLGHKVIYNDSNRYEVQMSPEHLVHQVIDTFLAQILPAFSEDATAEERLRGEERCRFLVAEMLLLFAEEDYEAILETLTAHWHDPFDSRWIRVMNLFKAVEAERYTVMEIPKGQFLGDWQGNHVERACKVKDARKPYKHTNAQLATVHAERQQRPSLASALPRGVIRLRQRKPADPGLRDFSPTIPRLPAVKA